MSGVAGTPFDLLGDDVFASNGLVHEQMIRIFKEVMERRGGGGTPPHAAA
jgi:hypothetical protein